jgi:DNA polymerase IIIc chi subunit
MSECTFHDLGTQLRDRKLFELAENAYARNKKVVIFTSTGERAADVDRLLWIMKQEAFVPHRIFAEPGTEHAEPIAIVTREFNPIGAMILIADGHCSLDFAANFEEIHEFVDRSSPGMQQACRDRFRAYRDRQFVMSHLK